MFIWPDDDPEQGSKHVVKLDKRPINVDKPPKANCTISCVWTSLPFPKKNLTLFCDYVSVETYNLYQSQKYFVIVGRWRNLSVALRSIEWLQRADAVGRYQYVEGTAWEQSGNGIRRVFVEHSVKCFGQGNSRSVMKIFANTGRKSDMIQLRFLAKQRAQTFLNSRFSS
jgi:hypothetical protein